MTVVAAKVVRLHWDEQTTAVQEATLEVVHPNGDRQLFVLAVLRMTDRLGPSTAAAHGVKRS